MKYVAIEIQDLPKKKRKKEKGKKEKSPLIFIFESLRFFD